MPDLQLKKSSKSYDVCIVGSGAGGGMAAFTLANDVVTLQWASIGTMRENEAYQITIEDVTRRMEREIELAAALKDPDAAVRLEAARAIATGAFSCE